VGDSSRRGAGSGRRRDRRGARLRYSDAPSKFVESEVDLDDAIKQCGLCAAAPELYGELARLGGVSSIVNLVAHENADVSASAARRGTSLAAVPSRCRFFLCAAARGVFL